MNGRDSTSFRRRRRQRRRVRRGGLLDGYSVGACIIAAAVLAVIWGASRTPSVQHGVTIVESQPAFGREGFELQRGLKALRTEIQSATRSAEDGKVDVARLRPLEAEVQRVFTAVEENSARGRAVP